MKKWHMMDISETLNTLKTNINGLSEKEAQIRLEKYGKNLLPKKKSDSFLKILFRQ